MPKKPKVYPGERRQWLEWYESGRSIPVIANTAGRDSRTVQKQLHLAADERERAIANTQRYRDAMRKHDEDLLGVIRGLRGSLWVPHDEQLTILPFVPRVQGNPVRVAARVYSSHHGELLTSEVFSGDEDSGRLLELAKEHYAKEKDLWRSLDGWVDSVDEYVRLCCDLGAKIGALACQSLGTEIVEQGEGLHAGYIAWPCRIAIEEHMGDHEVTARQSRISGNELRYDGSGLANFDSHEMLEKADAFFQELMESLRRDVLVADLARIKRALKDKLPGIKRQLGDLLLLGLVPGRCSVCRKLVM